MWKNCTAAGLVLILLLAFVPALATEEPADFVYRDGVTFGMTMDEVKALEKNKPSASKASYYAGNDRRETLVYENEMILTFPCEITYRFDDSGLNQISVSIFDTNDPIRLMEDFAEIDAALIKKYGEPDGPTDIKVLYDTMNYNTYWGSKVGEKNFAMWHNIVTTSGVVSHSVQYKYDSDLVENHRSDGGI